MQNENFFNGFLKEAAIAPGMKLTSGADFLKKINSKLKSPIAGNAGGKVSVGVKASSYNAGLTNLQQKISPSQVAAQNARHAVADKAAAPISKFTANNMKSSTNAPGLRKELVGDHGMFSH